MKFAILYLFGYLTVCFIFLLAARYVWKRWLRKLIHDEKIDELVEEASEQYIEDTVHDTLERTLRRQNEKQ